MSRDVEGRFRCPTYKIKMRRAACALDYRRASDSAARRPRANPANGLAPKHSARALCVGCTIGEVHAKGRPHPDAPEVELARFVAAIKPGNPCPSCGEQAPAKSGGRGSATWARAWEHRCPHGSPCPGSTENEKPACCRPGSEVTAPELPKPPPVPAPSPPVPVPPRRPLFLRPAPAPAEEKRDMSTKGHLYDKTCIACGGGFRSLGARAKYCSESCKPAKPAKKRKKAAPKRRTSRTPPAAPASRPTSGLRGEASSGARELLELAGYQVSEVRTPAGVALFISGGAA